MRTRVRTLASVSHAGLCVRLRCLRHQIRTKWTVVSAGHHGATSAEWSPEYTDKVRSLACACVPGQLLLVTLCACWAFWIMHSPRGGSGLRIRRCGRTWLPTRTLTMPTLWCCWSVAWTEHGASCRG